MRTLYFCTVVYSSSSSFLCLISAVGDWMLPYFHTWCDLSANLGCRYETCCLGSLKTQDAKIAKNSPSAHHRTTLSGYVFPTKACIDNRKKIRIQQYLPTCPHNIVNFGPLKAEICSLVWGTSANFNGFCVLASLLHGTVVVGVSQTLRR